MGSAALGDFIDVFADEVLLAGTRVEFVFCACGGAGDWSGFLLERIVAAGFHLDRLVSAGDHRSGRSAEDFERAIKVNDALFGGNAASLILVALHTPSGR